MNNSILMMMNNVFNLMRPELQLTEDQRLSIVHNLTPILTNTPLRDRALELAAHVSHTTVEDYLKDADRICAYLMTGSPDGSDEADSLAL